MKARSTVLMGVVFIAFALGVWYLEIERGEPSTPAEVGSEVSLLGDADFARLARIELTRGARRVVLERTSDPSGSLGPWRW